jgi:hypothetical protein
MVVYLAFLIPVISAILLFIFYRHKTQWWEVTIPIVTTVIFVLVAKAICVHSLTADTEWLGGYVTEVQYYEPWNERVPCRHPVYCTRTVCSGSGKSRSCRPQRYVCGHVHAYDVDYHPKRWEAVTTLDDFGISEGRYDQLVRQFGTGKQFVELNRHYHTIDGDMYSTKWDKNDATLEPVAKAESYENRPKASHSIFHFQELDTAEIRVYKPFEYPEVIDHKQATLLGYNDKAAHHRLQVLNSELGASKQVRVFLLVFRNQPREAGFIQERYWQGGNMNEIVVCVGINNSNQINWGHTFSWTEATGVKIKIKNEIESEDILDLNKVIATIEDEVKFEWKRKDFHDFDYLNIDPTITQLIWIYILTILVNGGLAYWIVVNEFEDDGDGDTKMDGLKDLFKKKKKKHKKW